jgi:putative radical SAM enzyme (TIGR03279 family)
MQGMPKKGIRLLEVARGSIAERIGLIPGDTILSANSHDLIDELALKFHASGGRVDFHVRRQNGFEHHLKVKFPEGESLGVQVEEFRTKACNNSCLFCFVDQLPPDARPSLKIKDDDYRLSFLHGNYITLTNLTDKELDRIVEERLSPLYVSVHATDPDLRTRILGRKKTDDFGRKIRKLVRGKIRIHAQIVLMPGINDGKNLEKTVFDLFKLFPGVESAAIVPLGLSRHRTPRTRLKPVTPQFCRETIRQVAPWQEYFRARTGTTFVYLADEFYLQGKNDLPKSEAYDDFAQIEDGVGMVRSFLDEFTMALPRRRKKTIALKGTIATGRLFFPILQECIDQLNSRFGTELKVCPVENKYMGRRITVAGLLGGADIREALEKAGPGEFAIVPSEAISQIGGVFVDGLTPEGLSKRLGIPVYPGGRTVGDFFRLLFSLSKKRQFVICDLKPGIGE